MWKYYANVASEIVSGLKQLLLTAVRTCDQQNVAVDPDKENRTFLCNLFSQKVEGLFSRGYYNGPPAYQHQYHGIGFDPLLLLAGLAFLALLLQTVHILFYSKHAFHTPLSSLGRSEESMVQLAELVEKALQKYGNLHVNKKKASSRVPEDSLLESFSAAIIRLVNKYKH